MLNKLLLCQASILIAGLAMASDEFITLIANFKLNKKNS